MIKEANKSGVGFPEHLPNLLIPISSPFGDFLIQTWPAFFFLGQCCFANLRCISSFERAPHEAEAKGWGPSVCSASSCCSSSAECPLLLQTQCFCLSGHPGCPLAWAWHWLHAWLVSSTSCRMIDDASEHMSRLVMSRTLLTKS